MLLRNYFPIALLGALSISVGTISVKAYDLQTTPDYYWDSQNFGSDICIEQLNEDNLLDIIGSYKEGGSKYMFNSGPPNYCQFNQPGITINFGANDIESGPITLTGYQYGYKDIAMVNNGIMKFYENQRNGQLNLIQTNTLQSPATANWITLGKLTSEPHADPFVTTGWSQLGDSYIRVYNNTGNLPSNPTFSYSPIFSPGIPGKIQADRMRGQSVTTDIVVVYSSQLQLGFNNSGQLTFPGWTLSVGQNNDPVVDFCIGKVDPNESLDIIGASPNRVVVFLCYETGIWYNMQEINCTGGDIQQVALGEYNYDGHPDLLIATSTSMFMYPNNGQGYFVIENDPIVWRYDDLQADLGENCEITEMRFADLRGLGALSLVFTARGTVASAPAGAIGVFKDVTDPRVCPVRNFAAFDYLPEHHPCLTWLTNTEFDVSHYNVYRALMPDTTRPTQNNFTLIATVDHPDTSFIDTTVTIHTPHDNVHAWYAVTAEDFTDHESLWSEFLSCWGYYEYSYGNDNPTLEIQPSPVDLHLDLSPNPLNPSTEINFQLPVASQISLRVYDTGGRLVMPLLNKWCEVGNHLIPFDGSELPSGIYLVQLIAGEHSQTTKLVLLR